MTSHTPLFLTYQYESVAWRLSRFKVLRMTWIRISQDAEIPCHPSAVLRDIEPVSELTYCIAALSITFFSNLAGGNLALTGF